MSLGTTVGIASASPDETPTHKKYRLQDAAAKLLPNEAVSSCCRHMAPKDPRYPSDGHHEHVVISRNPENGRVSVGNVITCDRVWICPVCATRIGEQRRDELRLMYEHSGKHFALLTLTASHGPTDDLKTLLDKLGEALRHFKSGRWWQNIKYEYAVIGNVTSTEITYGEANGWHPHYHILLVMDIQPGHAALSTLEKDAKKKWLVSLEKHGLSGNWDRAATVSHDHARLAEYIAKHGHAPADEWTEAEEMTRARNKTANGARYTPWQLLDLYDRGCDRAGALFVEYAEATKGRNWIRWSAGLRDLVDLDALTADYGDEGIHDEGQMVEFMKLHKQHWYLLCNYRARPRFLDLCIRGDRRKAIQLLTRLVDYHNKRVKVE